MLAGNLSDPTERAIPKMTFRIDTIAPATCRQLAVLIDYHSFPKDFAEYASEVIDFLREKGRLVVKKAFVDSDFISTNKQKHLMLSEASIDLVVSSVYVGTGTDKSKMRLAVDAIVLATTLPAIDTFVIVIGEIDYLPLVSKLRELGRNVVLVTGTQYVHASAANYFDEVVLIKRIPGVFKNTIPSSVDKFTLLRRCLSQLIQGDSILARNLMPKMLLLDPAFHVEDYGHLSFGEYLLAAKKKGIVSMESSGSHELLIQSLLNGEMQSGENS